MLGAISQEFHKLQTNYPARYLEAELAQTKDLE
jgi:hypothetical protein